MPTDAKMVVISGPSGVGKSTLIGRLRADPRVWWSVSATTRAPREGEVEGEDYLFLDEDDFKARVDAGGFLEFALVHGNYYGTLRAPVEEALAAGRLPIFDLDVQGGMSVKQTDMPAAFVFIKAPSVEQQQQRLEARQTDDRSTITRRIQRAFDELKYEDEYDVTIVNETVEQALGDLVGAIERLTGVRLVPSDPPAAEDSE